MKDTIFVDLPVGIAKEMLQTEFGTFRSVEKSDIVLTRVTKPYSLPEEVAKHVALVDDIVRFPSVVRTLLSPLDSDPEFKSDATSSSASFSCGRYLIVYINNMLDYILQNIRHLLQWIHQSICPCSGI